MIDSAKSLAIGQISASSSSSVLERLPAGLFAVEKERRRVAKELHDEILPLIARLSRFVQSNCDPSTSSLPKILHNTIADMRDLLGELHPVDLEELGLVSALHTICNRYARKTGKCILFVPIGVEENAEPLESLCLYRAVQDVLLRFAQSRNDILVLTCDLSNNPAIAIRCVDKCVSSADWLTGPSGFGAVSYRAWCDSIGAEVRPVCSMPANSMSGLENNRDIADLNYHYDLTISLPDLRISSECKEERNCMNSKSIVDEERKRISSELSALIASNFAYLKEELNSLKNAKISSSVHEQFFEIDKRLKELVIGAYPESVLQLPLSLCIGELIQTFENSTGIHTTFEFESDLDELRLSFDAKFAMYRIAQECFNNVEKHSSASHVRVVLGCSSDSIILLIEDNGKGFTENTPCGGRGLKNIRERASEIRALLAVSAANSYESGMAVTFTLPHPLAN